MIAWVYLDIDTICGEKNFKYINGRATVVQLFQFKKKVFIIECSRVTKVKIKSVRRQVHFVNTVCKFWFDSVYICHTAVQRLHYLKRSSFKPFDRLKCYISWDISIVKLDFNTIKVLYYGLKLISIQGFSWIDFIKNICLTHLRICIRNRSEDFFLIQHNY